MKVKVRDFSEYKFSIQVLLSLFGALISAQQCSSEVKDLTMTPGANGEDVARATFAKIWDEVSSWNAKYEERDFFIRYAYADSSFGKENLLILRFRF